MYCEQMPQSEYEQYNLCCMPSCPVAELYRPMINHVTNPSLLHPHSIVFSSEEIVSVFAQRPRNKTFSFITNNILFAAESVSWVDLDIEGAGPF